MSRSQKILMDARIFRGPSTGVGRYLASLMGEVTALAPGDLDFRVLCFPGQDIPGDMRRHVLRGIGAWAKPLGFLQQIILPFEVKRAGCDLYHYPSFDPPWSPVHPFVATCYDIEPLRHPGLFSRKIVLYYRLFAAGLRRADRVIVISENTRKDLIDLVRIAPGRVKLVYLGVDRHFRPVRDPDLLSDLRNRHHLPENYILYLGNTMPHKNLERLVRAMEAVRKFDASIPLLLAGRRDKYRPAVARAIAAAHLEQTVRFLDRVPEDDLPALFSGARVFVYPSLYEGFGLPVLEAMACGAPVVSSDSSSIPEIAGDAALLINPRDTEAIAGAIIHLLRHREEAERLSGLGIARAREFTWRRCAEEHLAIYREALKK